MPEVSFLPAEAQGRGSAAGFGDDGNGIEAMLKSLGSGAWGGSREAIDRLNKSLQAGSGTQWGATNGGAFRYQDLETSFIATTFTMAHLGNTLYQRLLKDKVAATDIEHQFNRITGWGSGGPFKSEIATLVSQDVTLARASAQIKFRYTKRSVSDPLKLINGGQRAEQVQIMGGNIYLAETGERYLYEGNSDIVSVEYDGLRKTILANGTIGTDIIDLAGQAPTSNTFNNIAEAMAQSGSYGVPSDIYMDLEAGTVFDEVLEGDKERVLVYPNEQGRYVNNIPIAPTTPWNVPQGNNYGHPAKGYASRHGLMVFWPHTFCGFRKTCLAAAENTSCATTPTIALSEVTPATSYTLGTDLGTYRVRVSAENADGESAACVASTQALTAAANAVRVTITPGATRGAAYRIYVSPPGGAAGSERYVGRVVDSGGATSVFDVILDKRPHCFDAFVLQLSGEIEEMRALALAVLAIGRKILPEGDTYSQWSQFAYDGPAYYSPARMKLIRNIGKTTYVDGWPV